MDFLSRFEALNLSFKNMCKLKPLLHKWLEVKSFLNVYGDVYFYLYSGLIIINVTIIINEVFADFAPKIPMQLQ